MKKDEAITALIEYRLEQANTAIRDAKCLVEGNGSLQSIVNRSYYAMFYAALALLLKSGISTSKHSGVLASFDKEFVHKGIFPKDLSKDFHSAFELRQEFDYRITKMSTAEETEEIRWKAVHFVHAIQEYLLGEHSSKEELRRD
ncbi:MAG: HEPN domain-containing protein [Candidatus Omnitrophota bacterium]|jgi:uncharacterized protein (UPF0332 family)|nr:MAG: HEPN domain-containing protein [Candidatus Omnitrophota bacterium]